MIDYVVVKKITNGFVVSYRIYKENAVSEEVNFYARDLAEVVTYMSGVFFKDVS